MKITKEQVLKAANEFTEDIGDKSLSPDDVLANSHSLYQVELTMHIEEVFSMTLDDETIDQNPREWTVDQWCQWVVEQAEAQ